MTYQGRVPGPGVRLTEEETHAYQHHLIEERKAAYDALPKRSGLDKHLRREAEKRALWTFTGHLRGMHGVRGQAAFWGMTWKDLENMHSRLAEYPTIR